MVFVLYVECETTREDSCSRKKSCLKIMIEFSFDTKCTIFIYLGYFYPVHSFLLCYVNVAKIKVPFGHLCLMHPFNKPLPKGV